MVGEPDDDRFDLDRFADAQDSNHAAALAEIRRGTKRSHWMVHLSADSRPRLKPDDSPLRDRLARQARAYLAHPVLGDRYRACVTALQDLTGTTAVQFFGEFDAIKLRSSLTLFAEADLSPLFAAALQRWFGSPDPATLEILLSRH